MKAPKKPFGSLDVFANGGKWDWVIHIWGAGGPVIRTRRLRKRKEIAIAEARRWGRTLGINIAEEHVP